MVCAALKVAASSQREAPFFRGGFRHYMVLGPLPLAYGNRTMTKKFAFLIVATMSLAAPAYAQSVRVISGDIEHIYGPGGQLHDDDALRARNERAERDLQIKRIERGMALRQQEAEAEYERQRALADQAAATDYEQMQRSGSTGLVLGGPARVGHFSTRPRTQFRMGSRPIHH